MKKNSIGLSYFKIILSIFICMAISIGLMPVADASAFGSFSAQAIIPENQVDKNQTYFDLRLEPLQKQTVQLIVRNGDTQPIVANVALNAASTGRDGIIVYSQPDIRDDSLAISIVDIAKVVNPQIDIPASGSALVDIEIQMPAEPFDGVILGGLVVTADRQEQGDETVQSGVQIQNDYAYTIGLKITQSDALVEPDLHLRHIEPGLANYRTAVTFNLQNSEAFIMKEMGVTAQVYKQGSQDVFKELLIPDAEMAPNSGGDFVIDWQNEPLQPGAYRLRLTAEHEDRQWEWDEEFTIRADEANKANANAVDLPKKTPTWLYVSIAVFILAIIFILAFLIGRRSSKREQR